jgi:hypothetical protein
MSGPIASVDDVRAFIDEYFKAWEGTDEDLILSYYSETVSLEIPGTIIKGKAALRDQFVRPFIAGFPGNRHVVKNMIFGKDVVVVEWSFKAAHKGLTLLKQISSHQPQVLQNLLIAWFASRAYPKSGSAPGYSVSN